MLFNSYEFILLFFPLAVVGFFGIAKVLPERAATFWLVLISFIFYGWWDYRYVPLLVGSIVFNYCLGGYIEHADLKRKFYLIIGIVGNVALLGYFKYMDFFLNTVNGIVGTVFFDLPHIVLPLGISFFTFTQTAYLVDVYRGEVTNYSFLVYCEFVTIFPHLIAGPIISYKEMVPQFLSKRTFQVDWSNAAMGISLFVIGLFKKVVIADQLAPWVANVFYRADSLTFFEAWIGAIAYTFQLYFDFSGYSEMAIGIGWMLNLKLPMNFNSPYQALSIIEFWRRWHMSLGGWVKNYLYIPMGGNRFGELQKMKNLLISMMIIGLWHGAGWTFVLWGGMHGAALMINHQWRRLGLRLPNVICWGATFLFVVVCWVFFRAENFHDGLCVLKAMTDVQGMAFPVSYQATLGNYWGNYIEWQLPKPFNQLLIYELILLILLLKATNPVKLINSFKPNIIWLSLVVATFIYTILAMNSYSEFLYFRF